MNYDITFCVNKNCKDKRCIRHHTNAPKNIYITQADLSKSGDLCPTYKEDAKTLLDIALKNAEELFTKDELNLIKTVLEDNDE